MSTNEACLAHHRHQRALLQTDASTSISSCLVCLGQAQHLHRWGLGAPRCLEQSRHMLVLLGAPVSHTISTSEALLRADAWTSIDSYLLLVEAPGWHNISTGRTLVLLLLGAPVWHTIGTSGPCCEQMPRPTSGHALCVWG